MTRDRIGVGEDPLHAGRLSHDEGRSHSKGTVFSQPSNLSEQGFLSPLPRVYLNTQPKRYRPQKLWLFISSRRQTEEGHDYTVIT